MKLYLYVMAVLIVTAILYGGILPNMVSAPDTVSVIIGGFCAITWPVFIGWLTTKIIRKKLKNA